MSTKIYNGYRIKLDKFETFQFHLINIQQKILEKQKELILKKYSLIAFELFDRINSNYYKIEEINRFLEKEEYEICPILDSFMFLTKKIKEAQGSDIRSEFDYDFIVNAVYYNGYMYNLCHTDISEYIQIWESFPNIEDFSYWNNTDPPNDFIEKYKTQAYDKWSKRGDIWDEVLKLMKQTCMNFTPTKNRFIVPEYSEIIRYQPTVDERVKVVCQNLFFELYRKYVEEAEIDSNNIIKEIEKATKWAKEGEGLEILNKYKNYVRSKIKKNVSKDDLLLKCTENPKIHLLEMFDEK